MTAVLSSVQVEHAFNYLEIQGIACNKPTQVSDPPQTRQTTSTHPFSNWLPRGNEAVDVIVKQNFTLIVFTNDARINLGFV